MNIPVALIIGTAIALVLIYYIGRPPPGGPGRKEENRK